MRVTHWLTVTALVFAGCSSTPEIAVINEAAEALGGADRIQAANTLLLEGAGENGNLGQNRSPDSPLPNFKVSEFKRAFDFTNGRSRLEQTRLPTFVTANTNPQKQIQGLDGDVAFNVAANGNVNRASDQVAKDRSMEMYHHPLAALRAALAEGTQLSNVRAEGSDQAVDVTTAQGIGFTLYVNSGTGLPAKVVTRTYNTNLGDVDIETSFSSYGDSGGLQLPGRLTTRVDKYITADIQVSKSTVNAEAGDIAASQEVRSATLPPPAAPTVNAQEAGRGLWYLTGGSHHSVLAEFSDHLVLIEAPQNEQRVSAVLAKVKELQPGKPLKYVINTHHHFDHSGGIRRAMAEGVTLITHAGNKAFLEEMGGRQHASQPDMLSQNPKPIQVEGVSEKRVLQDSMRTLELYPVANAHSETMLIVYLPAERLLVEVDLYTPPAPNAQAPAAFPFAASLLEAIQKAGVRVERIMPLHGPGLAPYRNLVSAARSS